MLGPDAETLAALTRKYQTLLELRQARDRRGHGSVGSGVAVIAQRQRLRDLAQEFPGCLRELDTLSAAEIDRRVQALALTAAGGVLEPWMAWIADYHALMRTVFQLKNAGRTDGKDQKAAAMVASSATTDAALVEAVRQPPQGRLGIVVLRTLGARFGVAPERIAATLFPPRRRSPYQL